VPAQQNTAAGEASEAAKFSSASLGLADYFQAEMLHFRQSVNFGAGNSPGSPNWCAQMDFDRAGSRCTKAGRRSRSSSSRSSASTSPRRAKSCARFAHQTCHRENSLIVDPRGAERGHAAPSQSNGMTRTCDTAAYSPLSLIRMRRFSVNGPILAPKLTGSLCCLLRKLLTGS
jgi:hypothetical protein